MNKNAIIYLVRSSIDSIKDLNQSLTSLYANLLPTLKNSDLVIFHEKGFDEFKVKINFNPEFISEIKFAEIDLSVPFKLECKFANYIPPFFPHPTHGKGPIAFGHPGFSIGYRSMCRFFSGEIYRLPFLSEYDFYIRLDTDSSFQEGPNFSLFDWALENKVDYGFIKEAVQIDHPEVVRGLRFETIKYALRTRNYLGMFRTLATKNGKMYYTNFELGRVKVFQNKFWLDYYDQLDSTGGFYLFRWGDAPFKYIGIRLFNNLINQKPLPRGFTYTHGSTYFT